MKRGLLVLAALAVALVGFLLVRERRLATRPPGTPAGFQSNAAPAETSPAGAQRDPSAPVILRDAPAVFQRAFWRRPGSDVRLLHGERREWLDDRDAVQKWQWFVALEATPAFRAWLFEQNPFDLARATTLPSATDISNPPDWFPAADTWQRFTAHRVRGGQFLVLVDDASGRLFATDVGRGFAPPSQ